MKRREFLKSSLTVSTATALGAAPALRGWAEVLSEEFLRLRDASEQGHDSLLDEYGATDPAEFFAVATEHFFERPRQLLAGAPDLYRVLQEYYRQDPAKRLPADTRKGHGKHERIRLKS